MNADETRSPEPLDAETLDALLRGVRRSEGAPMSEAILCGSCCHDHNAPNGPTGCCDEHGPYMYFCADCRKETTDE